MSQKIIYKKINLNKKEEEIKYFETLKKKNYLTIGIEVTDIDLSNILNLNIDPQHSNHSPLTAIEYCFNNQNVLIKQFEEYKKIVLSTIRTDLDSIGSMAILTLLLNNDLKLDGDLILRLKAIAKSDRHYRPDWKNRKDDFFQFENYNIYGLPTGLSYICSDYNIGMKFKVMSLIEYLKTGTFSDIEKYSIMASKNLKHGIESADIEIIVPDKLAFVRSKNSGAVAAGYRFCPVVIAINEQFRFNKNKKGKKVTVAQYSSGYIDMQNLLIEIQKIENGWGGSDTLIGSSQSDSSTISEKNLEELTKKYLKNN